MKIKLIPVVVAALVLMPSAVSAKKSIYRNGWIDFNKNGLKDVYEDPSAQLCRCVPG